MTHEGLKHDPLALRLDAEALEALARLFTGEILVALYWTRRWPRGADESG